MRRIAECKVITIVLVVGDKSFGVYCCGREIDLVFLRTPGQCYGVCQYVTCLQEIFGRVVVTCRLVERCAPAMDCRTAGFAFTPRAVAGLEVRQAQRVHKFRVTRNLYLCCSGLTFFGGNEHCAVRGVRTVQCRGCGSGHNGYRFNVIGVHIGDGFRCAA